LNSTTAAPAFNDGPDGLERLDRTIFLAEQKGIRLILPLANYWDDFGGVNQYLQWFGLKGRDQFYRNADVSTTVLNVKLRKKEGNRGVEPTIAGQAGSGEWRWRVGYAVRHGRDPRGRNPAGSGEARSPRWPDLAEGEKRLLSATRKP
jgi:hypothetical protein